MPFNTTKTFTLQLSTPNIHTLIVASNSAEWVIEVNNTTLTLRATAGYALNYWNRNFTISLSGNTLTVWQDVSGGFGGYLAYY